MERQSVRQTSQRTCEVTTSDRLSALLTYRHRLWQLHPVGVAGKYFYLYFIAPVEQLQFICLGLWMAIALVFGSATMVQSRSSSFSYGLPAAQTQSSVPHPSIHPADHPTIQPHSQVLVFSFTLSPSRGPIIIIIDGEAEEWMLFSGQDHKFSKRKAARRRRRRCINYVANCCVRISMTKAHKRNALHLWPFAGRGWTRLALGVRMGMGMGM